MANGAFGGPRVLAVVATPVVWNGVMAQALSGAGADHRSSRSRRCSSCRKSWQPQPGCLIQARFLFARVVVRGNAGHTLDAQLLRKTF
jgi:hypothetical protein